MSAAPEMRDWSIDLETLDTKYSSAIVSIGMVQFDRETGQIGIKHYAEVDLDSAMKAGTVSGSTLSRWATQSDQALRVFNIKGKTPLACALSELSTILRSKGAGPRVWGNGSSFDITILEHAFHNGAHGLAVPWQYWDIRDMRTIIDAAAIETKQLQRVGVHHNALDDAEFQAIAISMAWRKIKEALGVKLPPWKGPTIVKGEKPAALSSKPLAVPEKSVTPEEEDDEL